MVKFKELQLFKKEFNVLLSKCDVFDDIDCVLKDKSGRDRIVSHMASSSNWFGDAY